MNCVWADLSIEQTLMRFEKISWWSRGWKIENLCVYEAVSSDPIYKNVNLRTEKLLWNGSNLVK